MEGITDRGWSLDAAEAGLAAGLLFAAFEMIVGAVMTGTEGFFRPVRMIGAIVLGPRALSPAYSLSTALIVGIVVHLILSVCFALLFIVIAQPWTMRSVQTLLVLASIYGPLLWLANFYVVAPAAGWYWLPHQSSAAIQLCAHMLYGWRLGMFLRRPALVGVESGSHGVHPVRRV